jgi:ABC-type polysaccharide/polyol phosphate transport system ATPase subunit
MNRQKPAVQLRDVGKRFALYGSPLRQMLGYLGFGTRGIPHKQAIDGVNLTIAHGEKVGVVGHNGSGKTTLLRLITGFTRPTSGQVEVDGTIQALMQRGYGFNDALSGLENIRNALVYNGLPASMLAEAEADIVDFVELGEFLHHPVKTYSLGMRARLEFAAATAIHPDVLVIDEVLGAGDGYFVHKSARRMRQLVADTTLLLVSHSLDQIREYCDRVIWMDGGRLREDGPMEQVLGNYRRYMSERSARILRGSGSGAAQEATGRSAQRQVTLREKLKTMFGSGEDGGRINFFTFEADAGSLQALETGDPLALRLDVTLDRPMRAVILGLTVDGGFVFEMGAGAELPVGRHTLVVNSPRLEVGVGNYILVPALSQSGREAYPVIGTIQLELQMAATNWSDPPLVHLDGQWFSGAERKPINSKVNAWV